HTYKGDDEFIGYIAVVRFLHTLNWINIGSAFPAAGRHGVEGFQFPFPALVAIHRIITPANRSDLSNAIFAHLLLKLLDVARPIGGERITAVHEAMNEGGIDAVLQ